MTSLIIATRNKHKVQEIRAIMGDRYRILSLQEFPEAPRVVEDESTFAGNAVKKARGVARWIQGMAGLDYRVPGVNALVVADDSGLEVDALQGAPGVHSARFASLPEGGEGAGVGAGGSGGLESASDAANNEKLLRLLRDVPQANRGARFCCVLASFRIKPVQPTLAGQTFEGVCAGSIHSERRGEGGFGYDPLFWPEGSNQSFAELGAEVKNQVSHRVQALRGFQRYLQTLGL